MLQVRRSRSDPDLESLTDPGSRVQTSNRAEKDRQLDKENRKGEKGRTEDAAGGRSLKRIFGPS